MEPRCPYFGRCGGCQTQHIAYEDQILNKKARLQQLLAPFWSGEITVHAGTPYEYRNRMDFIITPQGACFRNNENRGFLRIDSCPISEPRVNKLLNEVQSWLANSPITAFDSKNKRGALKYAVIRVADDTSISLLLNEDTRELAAAIDACKAFASTTIADNVVIAYGEPNTDESVSQDCFAIKGSEFLRSTFCGVDLEFHSQGFFQNNTAMAQRMVECAREKLRAQPHRPLIDAYGGVGTFGLALANDATQVTSIECFPLAKESVDRSAQRNSIKNISAITADAAALKKLNLPRDATYLMDPPRSGMHERVISHLLEVKPPLIIYVSCNPAQLARELVKFNARYSVKSVDLFDLFAQTNHMECMVTLEPRPTQ